MPLPMYEEKNARLASNIKHVLAIAAGKGGVGKSTVAVNLARALMHRGFAVGLMDTDVYGPSVRKMLPEDRMPVQKGEKILPALCEGIRMISMAYFRSEADAAVVRAPIANSIVTQFVQNVEWGSLDYLLIDFPPGTGDIQLTLSQRASLSGAIMVTTPQEISMMDVRKAINMFDQVKIPILGVVENMTGYLHKGTQEMVHLFGKGGGERLARETGVPLLGKIPIDPDLCLSCDKGMSLFNTGKEGRSSVADVFMEIAKTVSEHAEALEANRKDFLGSFELVWKEMSV